MNKGLHMGQLLGYKDFYPGKLLPDKLALAKTIGREKLLQFCSHFLAQFRMNHLPPTDQLLQEFFTFKEYRYYSNPHYQYIKLRYDAIVRTFSSNNFTIVSIESLLNQFLWLTKNHDIVFKVEASPQKILPLFQLLLVFNDELLERYKNAYKEVKGIGVDRRIQQLTLAMSFPQNDFINADYAQLLKTQFYKSALLFEFMNENSRYQSLLMNLLTDFKSSDIKQYFQKIGAAVMSGIKVTKGGWTMIVIPPDNEYERNCFLLDKLSVDETPIEDLQDDYLGLRNRPLYKFTEGQYLMIYDLFLIKKIYNGSIFYLSSLVNKDHSLLNGPFFGAIRDDFSEGILVYNIFDYIFPGTEIIKISGAQFKKQGLAISEPDYYVRVGNDILLIESKDFYVPGKTKLSYDFELIEADLKKGRLGKAVEQLKTNIQRIILKTLSDIGYDTGNASIFPVIIVHDALYSAPGLNYWVHFWLDDLTKAIKEDQVYSAFDFERLWPVTIVEIDTLMFYEENFRAGQLNLIDLISQFHSDMNYKQTNIFTPEDVTSHAYNSVIPFSEFVRRKAKEKDVQLQGGRMNVLFKKLGIPD